MKRIIVLLILMVCAIQIIGCSNIPSGMNAKTYEYGKKALKIIDKYNDGDISRKYAQTKLSNLEEIIDRYGDELVENNAKEEEIDTNNSVGYSVYYCKMSLSEDSTISSFEKADELREELGLD